LLVREVVEPGEQLCLARKRLLAPDAVDGAVSGGSDDPRAGIRGQTVLGPADERSREGVLDGVLRQLEVAEHADEDRHGTAPLLAEDKLDRGCHRFPQRRSTGRISTEPYSDAGIAVASLIASSRSGSSTRKSPPTSSFVSANGPSVTMRSPLRTRT